MDQVKNGTDDLRASPKLHHGTICPWADTELALKSEDEGMPSAGWVSPDAPVQPDAIRKVHLVQSCHLDVGFTALAIDVINQYFDEFLPAAVATAAELAANASAQERLVFTAQSWILGLYLECDSAQAARFPLPPARTQPNCSAAQNCQAHVNDPGTNHSCRHALTNCSATAQVPTNEAACLAVGCCWVPPW